MFNFFQSILDTLGIMVDFAINFVQGLANFVTSLASGSVYLIQTVQFLPAEIVGVALTIIAISVVFMLLNR